MANKNCTVEANLCGVVSFRKYGHKFEDLGIFMDKNVLLITVAP